MTKTDSGPTDTTAVGTAPVGAAPVDTAPVGAAPVDTAPVGAARRSQLRRASEVVRTAVATVELLRADAGGVARASGWWSPSGLLLHRTRPGRAAPYVCTSADALGPAVLRALLAGGPHAHAPHVGANAHASHVGANAPRAEVFRPIPAAVAVGSVREVLAVARGAERGWIGELGARHCGEVALLRWEIRWPDQHLLAVRALVIGPAGAAVIHDRGSGGTHLEPTDAAIEDAALAQVRDVLVARCHLEVARVARTTAATSVAHAVGVNSPAGRRAPRPGSERPS